MDAVLSLCVCWQQSSIIVFNTCVQADTEKGLGEPGASKRWYILLRERNANTTYLSCLEESLRDVGTKEGAL